jgi:hypothetical protein
VARLNRSYAVLPPRRVLWRLPRLRVIDTALPSLWLGLRTFFESFTFLFFFRLMKVISPSPPSMNFRQAESRGFQDCRFRDAKTKRLRNRDCRSWIAAKKKYCLHRLQYFPQKTRADHSISPDQSASWKQKVLFWRLRGTLPPEPFDSTAKKEIRHEETRVLVRFGGGVGPARADSTVARAVILLRRRSTRR